MLCMLYSTYRYIIYVFIYHHLYRCFSFENPVFQVYTPQHYFIYIVDHERVTYSISFHLTVNHLNLATKYIHTFMLNVNRVAY